MVLVVGAPEDVLARKVSSVWCTWGGCEPKQTVWDRVRAGQCCLVSAVAVELRRIGMFVDQKASCAVVTEARPHRSSVRFPGPATVVVGFGFLLHLDIAHLYLQAWLLQSREQRKLCFVCYLEKVCLGWTLPFQNDWLSHLLRIAAFFHPRRGISVERYCYLLQVAGYKEVFETKQGLEHIRCEERWSGNPVDLH